MNPEIHAGVQLRAQPTFQLLIADLLFSGKKGRPEYLMRPVLDPPHHPSPRLIVQDRGIGQGRQPLADRVRVRVVVLELDPLGFLRQSKETIQPGTK